MTAACYVIEKISVGWVIRASGKAVLICGQKRMAVNTARIAGELLVRDGEISAHEHGVESCVHVPEYGGARDAIADAAMRLKIAQ